MSHDRNIKWLNDRRVIYRRNPVNDVPSIKTALYEYYEDGTHEAYHLFNSRAKITTYRSLKWHFYVLYYLNEDWLSPSSMTYIFKFIANKENGFVTFFIKNKLLEEIIQDVLTLGGDPPKNKLRKIIFKMSTGLSIREKLSIVGRLIVRSKIDNSMVYDTMLYIKYGLKQKVTISRIAKILNCSTRTIYRNMNSRLKIEKYTLNEEL